MAVYRVEVFANRPEDDPTSGSLKHELHELGFKQVQGVDAARVFLLQGDAAILTPAAVARIAQEVLIDPVVESYTVGTKPGSGHLIDVHLKPGVMDPVAGSCEIAISDLLGLDEHSPKIEVRTGRRVRLLGDLTAEDLQSICKRLLVNDSIEAGYLTAYVPDHFPVGKAYEYKQVIVAIRNLDDAGLLELSRRGHLFLDLAEMKAVQDYFRSQNRDPVDVELETLAQTWSEHCVHKTLKATVSFTIAGQNDDQPEVIRNLVKSTIFKATQDLNKPWCLSVFKDNAGVIAFDADNAVCMKVETHNRPSAIEPYGGAATGIGGVIRDVIGTGLGAKPVANTDIFCFADPTTPAAELPAGVIHPRRIAQRVVAGVRDYGNRMGIPTVNGAVYFDARYVGNPLVFCGTVGVMPNQFAQKGSPKTGDCIVVMGGRTGRDGIHGATFSSDVITDTHADEFSHAVQIGNAITEKRTLDVILQARDQADGPLFNAITDCGAGGLSSAIGEMGEKSGATVHLDRVPLKYDGLSYAEIWISEAQERMVLAVPPEKLARLLELSASEDVEATNIGTFDGTGNLTLFYHEHQVGKMAMAFIHDGIPQPVRQARYTPPQVQEPVLPVPTDYAHVIHQLLARPTLASKHWIIRQYDHEVQGGTLIKPLVGPGQNAPGDGAVVRPVPGSTQAVALAVGCQFPFADIDPYQGALNGMDEALRNIVCVGGDPKYTAVLDNFCWPKCSDPQHLGALVLACKACYDGAMAYGVPFISGKDSLSNEFITSSGQRICIPYTLLISAISVMAKAPRALTSDAKQAGNYLVLVGQTKRELGGSQYYALNGHVGSSVPQVDLKQAPRVLQAVADVIASGLAVSAHDCSEGGLGVALAEMCFGGGLGATVDLAGVSASADAKQDAILLFAESATRIILEVPRDQLGTVLKQLQGIPVGVVGELTTEPNLKVRSIQAGWLMNEPVAKFQKSWLGTLDW